MRQGYSCMSLWEGQLSSPSLFQSLVEVMVYLRKARTAMEGVLMAASLYPAAPCVMVLTGVLKGICFKDGVYTLAHV